jgi:hypothetical protein
VDESETVIRKGTYEGHISSGNEMRLATRLAQYQPKRGSRTQVILTIHQAIVGYENAHPKLEIQEDPNYGLALPFEYAEYCLLTVIVSGSGGILLWTQLSRCIS